MKWIPAVAVAMMLLPIGSANAHSHGAHHHVRHRTSPALGGGYYTNSSGHSVHRPVFSSQRPAGASARCGDGSYSFSEHHRGTCSHHGGVATWY